MSRNDVTLSGVVTELEPLRYTPAGVPQLSFRLVHQSKQMEAQHERSVSLDLPVMVLGELAREIKKLMDRYGLEPAAVARMLIVDGLEARRARVA